jgi:hypothetical protein
MRHRRASSQLVLLALLLGLIAGIAAGPAMAAALQPVYPELGLYQSPTFGYLLRWDTGRWSVDEESSAGGLDHLVLAGDGGTVQFDAYEGFGGDTDACLADAADRVSGLEWVANMEAAQYEDGTPTEYHLDGRAYSAFMVAGTASDGRATDYVVQIECRTLIHGSAVLQMIHIVPAEDYAAAASTGDFELPYLAVDLMASVALPRAAFWLPSFEDLASSFSPVSEYQYFSQAASQALATVRMAAADDAVADPALGDPDPGTHWAALTLAFDNAASEPLTVDVSGVVVTDQYGFRAEPVSVAWEGEADAGLGEPRSLDPGQSANVTLLYALPDGSLISGAECACLPDIESFVASIASLQPRAGWLSPDSTYGGDCLATWKRSVVLFGLGGEELATFTASSLGFDASGSLKVLLAVENSGTRTATVDPSMLSVFTPSQGFVAPSAVSWPASGGGQSLDLAPGERPAVIVTFPVSSDAAPFELIYAPGPDQSIWLATLHGACGAGARPVIWVRR